MYTKYLYFLLLLTFACCSISRDPNKSLNFELIEPTKSINMAFQDSLLSIEFWFSRDAINFTLNNKSRSTIKIIWDEAAFVQFGQSQRIMHAGIKYIDRSQAQPPTSIPSGASITDLATPTDNVYYSGGQYGTGWKTEDIFKIKDALGNTFKENKGKYDNSEITFLLPIEIKGNRSEYNFKFKVSEIRK